MKQISRWLVALMSLSLILTACSGAKTEPGNGGTNPGTGAPQQVSEVRFGVLLPLTGGSAAVGQDIKTGVDFAIEEINNNGGIKSLGGAKVKAIYGDTQGTPDVGRSEAERLITEQKVSVLAGAFQSAVTLPSAQVAEQHQVPYMVLIAVANDITEKGFTYVFRAIHKASMDSPDRINFLKQMGDKTGKKVQSIALVYENTEWGQSAGAAMKANATQSGIKVVVDEAYPANASDLSSVAAKVKAAKPDAVFLASYLNDGVLLTKGFAEVKLDATVITNGVEHGNPGFLPAVGKKADYQFWTTPWHIKLLDAKTWAKPINDRYKAKNNHDFTPYAATAFSDIYIVKEAIEKAASADRTAIRNALASIELTSGPALIRSSEKISFDKTGQNPNAYTLIMQTVDSKDYVAYPLNLKTPNFEVVWPTPPWDKR